MSEEICPGQDCGQFKVLRSDMEHHSHTISEATLSIRECVNDIKEAGKEVSRVFGDMRAINERLREGAEKFAGIESSLAEHDVRLRITEGIAKEANKEAKSNSKWVFWMITVPLAALIIGAIGYIFRNLPNII